MTGYVMVHGAWHGSWCWAGVRRSLISAGHEVFAPTLIGLGEQSNMNRDVGLGTQSLEAFYTQEPVRELLSVPHWWRRLLGR